jgi:hypothetical protein
MLKKLTLSAVLAGILATTASSLPTPKHHDNSTVPVMGAEAWPDFLPSATPE